VLDLNQIKIVLVAPSHPGNIGATARAMKNMGLSHLTLVSPKDYPSVQATALASGADDVLQAAFVCNSVEEALGDCHYVYATTARHRKLGWPACDVRTAATEICSKNILSTQKIAILFGCERAGLDNDTLVRAQTHIYIPTNPAYSSLNLAQAVQLICYELKMTHDGLTPIQLAQPIEEREAPLANLEKVEGFYQHLEEMLMHIHFLDAKQPKMLMGRLRRLFNRARLCEKEVHILRGICKAVLSKTIQF
jgi:TrmH family RNA methyltransferase